MHRGGAAQQREAQGTNQTFQRLLFSSTQGEPDGAPAEDPAEVTKRIAAALPSSREAVFAHPLDWAMFDAAKATLAPRLSAWVDKKIQDMLGEREESMVRALSISRRVPFITHTSATLRLGGQEGPGYAWQA